MSEPEPKAESRTWHGNDDYLCYLSVKEAGSPPCQVVTGLRAELAALRSLLAEYHREQCEGSACGTVADCHVCEVIPRPHDHAVNAKTCYAALKKP